LASSLSNKIALITGASSGLGADFARQLAREGAHVVLVARRLDLLEKLKAEIQASSPVKVHLIPMDLTSPQAPQKLLEQIGSLGLQVDCLVNNAGFGVYGEILELPLARQLNMIDLNIRVLVELSYLFASGMKARGAGFILQVASIGAYQATPFYGVYSATKAFVLSFGEALHFELKKFGVKVTNLCPGYTETEFLQVSGQKRNSYQLSMAMKSEEVVRIGIQAMLQGRAVVTPGWKNKFGAFMTRLLPRFLQRQVAYTAMKN